jgi:antiviral helicase SLH1
MSPKQVAKLADKLQVPADRRAQFAKVSSMLPNLNVSVESVTSQSVTVSLRRINALVERDARIWAPKWPKAQTEGWIVMLAETAKPIPEVLALKRVGWLARDERGGRLGVGARPSAKVTLNLSRLVIGKLDVIVVSDAYIGLEYTVKGVEMAVSG